MASLVFLIALVVPALSGAREHRSGALTFAAYFASFWILANLATTGRPDAFALALASVALVRVLRRGELCAVASALFVVAAFVKPTVVSLGASVMLAEVVRLRARVLRPLLGALLAFLGLAVPLWLASDGALFWHVTRANGQPLLVSQWLGNVPRLIFFGPPCAVAFLACRGAPGNTARIARWALVGSFAWTCFALGKVGSASNYWLEPVVATIASVAHFGAKFDWSKPLHAALACAQVFYVEIAASRSALERYVADKEEARFVQRVRDACQPAPHHVVMSDHAGIEYLTNGRIVTTAFQLAHATERGYLPQTLWRDLLTHPAVTCFVVDTGIIASMPFADEALSRGFTERFAQGSYRLFRRRELL
jgi:hypothetical protein